jgi:uncharacterized protein (TIGR03067 family)
MRFWMIGVAAMMLVGSAFAADTKDAEVSKKLIGTWQMKEGVAAGEALEADTVKALQLEMTDGKYTLKGAENIDRGTWVIRTGQKPFEMDIKGTEGAHKDQAILAIFELDGDKMRVCYDLSGQTRPKTFESKANTTLFLASYERVKQ